VRKEKRRGEEKKGEQTRRNKKRKSKAKKGKLSSLKVLLLGNSGKKCVQRKRLDFYIISGVNLLVFSFT